MHSLTSTGGCQFEGPQAMTGDLPTQEYRPTGGWSVFHESIVTIRGSSCPRISIYDTHGRNLAQVTFTSPSRH